MTCLMRLKRIRELRFLDCSTQQLPLPIVKSIHMIQFLCHLNGLFRLPFDEFMQIRNCSLNHIKMVHKKIIHVVVISFSM